MNHVAPLAKNPSVLTAHGRLGRLAFAAWNFLLMIASLILFSVLFISFPDLTTHFSWLPILSIVVLYLVMMYFGFVFMIQRLHDRNQSGWWSLLCLVPFINLLLTLFLLFAKGDRSANRYGPPRNSPMWEKILGWIYLLTIPLLVLAAILFTAFPAFQDFNNSRPATSENAYY